MSTAGLCGVCRYGRPIRSGKGSVFLLCERSRHEPAHARYPRLPMLECPGFEAGSVEHGEGPRPRPDHEIPPA